MIKAYISYKREDGIPSKFVEDLINWRPEDIELKVDYYDAEHSKSIHCFTDQLKTSSNVIFLLSENYFKSHWCMDELYEFTKEKSARFHGCFVACNSWVSGRDTNAALDELWKVYASHWENEVQNTKCEYKKMLALKFSEGREEILNAIKDVNMESEAHVRESVAENVWKRLRKNNERSKSIARYEYIDGNGFQDHCEKWFLDKLDDSDILREKLIKQLDAKNAKDVVTKLWSSDVQERIAHLHKSAKRAIRVASQDLISNLRKDAFEMLSVLLLGLIDLESRDKLMRPKYGLFDALELALPETSVEVVELVYSSLSNNVTSQLDGDRNVKKTRCIAMDNIERGAKFSVDSKLDQLLGMIWNFTDPSKESKQIQKGYFTKDELQSLNMRLRSEFLKGNGCYLVVQSEKEGGSNFSGISNGVIEDLKYTLPYLFVFRTGVKTQPKLLKVEYGGEAYIKYELDSFAKLFN